ncbi:MAG TPA: aminotransferase class V-fold PLP-dependent enzyme, partial [candidate division Zixibacteria bacterium]|nr:aminotransferase class V-fold PLP-dependent enzyme [candidate division Zixibacteria bacterium]
EAMSRFNELAAHTPWRQDLPVEVEFERIRELGSQLMNAPIDGVTIGYTTGHGASLAAAGLPLQRGDEVILTDNEFPSLVYPWMPLRERGVTVKFARSVNGRVPFESFAACVTNRTKVIAVSFVQYYNGAKAPLEKLSELTRDIGAYFIVDGIQGLGPEPIDLSRLRVDLFSAGSQKWLLGPAGIGLLYLSERLRETFGPVAHSWRSVPWDNYVDLAHYDRAPFGDARRISLGTLPFSHVIGLSSSLQLLVELGADAIQGHTHGLLDQLIVALSESDRFRILSPLAPDERSAILSFTADDYEDIFDRLIAAKIICVKREGGIRISPYIYNTPDDIIRLIELLRV